MRKYLILLRPTFFGGKFFSFKINYLEPSIELRLSTSNNTQRQYIYNRMPSTEILSFASMQTAALITNATSNINR